MYTKQRIFQNIEVSQYRLLQRALVTNVHLFKWKIRENDLCTFCSLAKETISHVIFQCEVVQNLWTKVFDFIKEQYPGTPPLYRLLLSTHE